MNQALSAQAAPDFGPDSNTRFEAQEDNGWCVAMVTPVARECLFNFGSLPALPNHQHSASKERAEAVVQQLNEVAYSTVFLQGAHSEPEACPTYYDGCHCTVETLLHSLKRLATLEESCKDGGCEVVTDTEGNESVRNLWAEELELRYRRELWQHHGHSRLYGDEGEMQCNECLLLFGFHDYKRHDLGKLEAVVAELRMKL